jgi:periplasmic divalent cation tolerance protein
MERETGCRVAYTSLDSRMKAGEMARALVDRKCVACVNIIGPMDSVYEWKGQVETVTEWMLMMKCSEEQVEQLKKAVLELHDYEVPELIVLPVIQGHAPYLQWIRGSEGAQA